MEEGNLIKELFVPDEKKAFEVFRSMRWRRCFLVRGLIHVTCKSVGHRADHNNILVMIIQITSMQWTIQMLTMQKTVHSLLRPVLNIFRGVSKKYLELYVKYIQFQLNNGLK